MILTLDYMNREILKNKGKNMMSDEAEMAIATENERDDEAEVPVNIMIGDVVGARGRDGASIVPFVAGVTMIVIVVIKHGKEIEMIYFGSFQIGCQVCIGQVRGTFVKIFQKEISARKAYFLHVINMFDIVYQSTIKDFVFMRLVV
eukprot:TRINITY_DN19249_c0_g1_i4.p2 TRINITY_DN19249_c0_g1~~TRINITY_DN19249_c0_g1_i4.p2  ORF type:complete len:146 (-),score=9.96 TRINITY_DN19249_c0_g1_i4:9-446(-)